MLYSRVAGLAAPLDGVITSTVDQAEIASDSAYAASLGFGGKLAIHPMQIPIVLSAFRPSAADIAWARETETIMKTAGGAAVRLKGMMVDTPVLERTRCILARA